MLNFKTSFALYINWGIISSYQKSSNTYFLLISLTASNTHNIYLKSTKIHTFRLNSEQTSLVNHAFIPSFIYPSSSPSIHLYTHLTSSSMTPLSISDPFLFIPSSYLYIYPSTTPFTHLPFSSSHLCSSILLSIHPSLSITPSLTHPSIYISISIYIPHSFINPSYPSIHLNPPLPPFCPSIFIHHSLINPAIHLLYIFISIYYIHHSFINPSYPSIHFNPSLPLFCPSMFIHHALTHTSISISTYIHHSFINPSYLSLYPS